MNWELLGWATLWGFLWCQVVTHYGVSKDDIDNAVEIFKKHVSF